MAVLTLPQATQLAESVRAKALVFEDPRSVALLARIQQVAPSGATVLVTGETGTGKEIVARYIHALSARAHKPFVAINCATFSESLVDSELFGHERGAFTGADRAKAGWFEAAHGGTLFMDEVGDLAPQTQVRLLRVLQESEVVRLGARQSTPIDVRLIAATNVDLEQAIDAGHFREDLYYRLHVTTLRLLPLRERPGDIPPLARHFAELYGRRSGRPELRLAHDAQQRLLEHSWPGNIRELENAIHHATLVCRGELIHADHLQLTPSRRRSSVPVAAPPVEQDNAAPHAEALLEDALKAMFEADDPALYERIEEIVFRTAYTYCERNQLQTARLLGISRNIVRGRLAQLREIRAPLRSLPAVRGAPQTRVRIGYQRFGLLFMVKAAGVFDAALARRGIQVEWVNYPAGPDLLVALRDDLLDVGLVGECPPVYAQANDVPFVYLGAEAPAPEAEAIIVHAESPLRSVADLRGKRVALNPGANVHYLLIRALEEAELGYHDIELSFGSPEESRSAFQRREVDAWAIWDPLLASVQHATPTRVLRDARGLTHNAGYYVARRAFAERQRAIVDDLLAHVEHAARMARAEPERTAARLASELGVSADGLTLALRRHSGTAPVSEELLRSQQNIADTLHRMQLIPRAVSVSAARW